MKHLFFILSLLVSQLTFGTVKMSPSGICHDASSPYYVRILYYEEFEDMALCIEANGRPYTQYNEAQLTESAEDSAKYNRDRFGEWADEDADCMNSRHELLSITSTEQTYAGSNPCTIETGKWYDPYTNKYFYKASNIDIDHIVPLKWAWEHGADKWTDKQRKAFANDPLNLIPVNKTVNRSKGAKGLTEWLPPNTEYRCQYIIRYTRIVAKYSLSLTPKEKSKHQELSSRYCTKR